MGFQTSLPILINNVKAGMPILSDPALSGTFEQISKGTVFIAKFFLVVGVEDMITKYCW